MASNYTANKLRSNMAVEMYDHDPGGTSALVVTPDGGTTKRYADMRGYENFMAVCMASALTGAGVTAFTLVANTDSDGSGTDRTIVSHAVGSAPDAVGDFLVLECTAEQIAAVGGTNSEDLRYVAAKLTCDNSADENVVTYIRCGARHSKSGLTADSVA